MSSPASGDDKEKKEAKLSITLTGEKAEDYFKDKYGKHEHHDGFWKYYWKHREYAIPLTIVFIFIMVKTGWGAYLFGQLIAFLAPIIGAAVMIIVCWWAVAKMAESAKKTTKETFGKKDAHAKGGAHH